MPRAEPVGCDRDAGPPMAALALVLLKVWAGPGRNRVLWALPLALLVVALALGFYQVRTLPYANVASIAVLGVWLGELATRYGVTSLRPSRAAMPVYAGFVIACPFTYLAIGSVAVRRAVAASPTAAIAPPETPTAPLELTEGLTTAQKECLDPSSEALFASVPHGRGRLLRSSTARPCSMLSRAQRRGRPPIIAPARRSSTPSTPCRSRLPKRTPSSTRGTSTMSPSARPRGNPPMAAEKAPDGLLAALLAGDAPAWLAPVPAAETTTLRLWRRARILRGRQLLSRSPASC